MDLILELNQVFKNQCLKIEIRDKPETNTKTYTMASLFGPSGQSIHSLSFNGHLSTTIIITIQCPRPGFEPGPLDLESSALTMRTPHLPHLYLGTNHWRVVAFTSSFPEHCRQKKWEQLHVRFRNFILSNFQQQW